MGRGRQNRKTKLLKTKKSQEQIKKSDNGKKKRRKVGKQTIERNAKKSTSEHKRSFLMIPFEVITVYAQKT